jgi:hypothetical protein
LESKFSRILAREGSGPDIFNIEAVAGFRDAIALCFVCKNRALRAIYDRSRHFQFSSWFDFYPWTTSVDYKGIIGQTPALFGWHQAKKFQGQSTPGLPHAEVDKREADDALLNALLGLWKRRFVTHKETWREVALFRSLNMAYAASQVPSGPDMTHYALGRAVALWVSAFEILSHSGEDGQSGYKNVYDLFHSVEWQTDKCREPIHLAYSGRGKESPNILACWIYGELFKARNDFLHGNSVALDRLRIPLSGKTIYNFAAPLYRMALTGILTIQLFGPRPSSADLDAFIGFQSRHHDIAHDQLDMERALGKILQREEDADKL